MTPAIKREMRRRAAIEPVIGHIKNGHRMDRNYLAGPQGDSINAVLAAAGYNFRLLLNWLRLLSCMIASLMLPHSYSAHRLQIA
jgi:IS5 family transposase